jgi:hypothetical protein
LKFQVSHQEASQANTHVVAMHAEGIFDVLHPLLVLRCLLPL